MNTTVVDNDNSSKNDPYVQPEKEKTGIGKVIQSIADFFASLFS